MLQDVYRQQRKAAGRAQSRHQDAVAQHRSRVEDLREQRSQARAQRRWRAWLLGSLSVWRERRRAPLGPVPAAGSADREDILKAGMTGERLAAAELRRALNDDWTLLRGYRNRRGEIDQILLGPPGLFAMEIKYRNATVHVTGDDWRFSKYDKHGRLVNQGRIEDGGGRSPSRQLNEPASELERFLRSRGQPARIRRIVLLNHPSSRLGSTRNLTVDVVATSTGYLLRQLRDSPAVFDAQQRLKLERLIVGDHRHHEGRRTSR